MAYISLSFLLRLHEISFNSARLSMTSCLGKPECCCNTLHKSCSSCNCNWIDVSCWECCVVNVVLRPHQQLLMASTICIFGNQIMFAIACSWRRHHCSHHRITMLQKVGGSGLGLVGCKVGKREWWWWWWWWWWWRCWWRWCKRWQANYTCQSQVTECAGSSGSGYLAICHAAMSMECRWRLRHKCSRCSFPIGGAGENILWHVSAENFDLNCMALSECLWKENLNIFTNKYFATFFSPCIVVRAARSTCNYRPKVFQLNYGPRSRQLLHPHHNIILRITTAGRSTQRYKENKKKKKPEPSEPTYYIISPIWNLKMPNRKPYS